MTAAYPPLNAPTGFRTGKAAVGVSINLALVWKALDELPMTGREGAGTRRVFRPPACRRSSILEGSMAIVGCDLRFAP